MFFYLDSFHLETWAHDILSIKDCVNDWLCPLRIVLTFGSVYFALAPLGSLSTWTLSTWESGHMTFCPCRIVSSIGSVNSGLSSLLVPSTWKSIHLGLYLLWFSPLRKLTTWRTFTWWLCPQLVLSNLDSAHFCSCLLGSLSTWVFVHLISVHFEVWPNDILPK